MFKFIQCLFIFCFTLLIAGLIGCGGGGSGDDSGGSGVNSLEGTWSTYDGDTFCFVLTKLSASEALLTWDDYTTDNYIYLGNNIWQEKYNTSDTFLVVSNNSILYNEGMVATKISNSVVLNPKWYFSDSNYRIYGKSSNFPLGSFDEIMGNDSNAWTLLYEGNQNVNFVLPSNYSSLCVTFPGNYAWLVDYVTLVGSNSDGFDYYLNFYSEDGKYCYNIEDVQDNDGCGACYLAANGNFTAGQTLTLKVKRSDANKWIKVYTNNSVEYEVWAGDTYLADSINGYDIANQGYTLLGIANASSYFFGDYAYYVLAKKGNGQVYVDYLMSYLGTGTAMSWAGNNSSGNVTNFNNIFSLNNSYAMVGLTSGGTGHDYSGFLNMKK